MPRTEYRCELCNTFMELLNVFSIFCSLTIFFSPHSVWQAEYSHHAIIYFRIRVSLIINLLLYQIINLSGLLKNIEFTFSSLCYHRIHHQIRSLIITMDQLPLTTNPGSFPPPARPRVQGDPAAASRTPAAVRGMRECASLPAQGVRRLQESLLHCLHGNYHRGPLLLPRP